MVSQRIIPGYTLRGANLTGESRKKLKTNGSLDIEEGIRYYYRGFTARF